MTRPAMSEAAWQTCVVDLARLYRWTVIHSADSRRQVIGRDGTAQLVGDDGMAGFPDLMLIRERVVFVELKTATGRLRPAQHRILTSLRRAGQEVYLWRPDDLDDARRVLALPVPPMLLTEDVGGRGRL
jgi:hypothetical protein